MTSRMYLHVDLDAFFASVEVLDNPEYRGKPLIVGGLPGERRSVVSTCSYEARKYGVHSAMPVNRAYELCPQAIFVHGRMERYHEKSQEVMAVFREYSPDVMQMSIDEAFIDITGTELLFGDPLTLAKSLKQKVRERTGLTVSVGIASNRYVAKIASGLKKPDGLCYVPAGEEEKFMLSLPLDKLWGIGTKSRERLNACGIFTIPEIHAISETALTELFGEASGSFLYRSVRGMDVEHFGDEAKSRSMSAEHTFCFDLSDIYSIETELLHLSYDVMFRVLKEKVNSRTVCLKIRYEDFTTVTITESSTRIVSSIEDLFERACRLFHKKYERGRGIRLLGLGLQNITDGLEGSQGELFDFGEKKQRSVEKTILKLHQKDPANRLKKARQLITKGIALFFLGCLPQTAYSESLISDADAQNIEFEVEGSWESMLSTGSSLVIGQEAPVLSLKTPVFTQKADLLLWFMYNNHWYFDASFATDSTTNYIAAGYEGDGIISSFRAGTDIGTESMSPGLKIRLQGNGWDASAQVHLDAVNARSKTWKGSSALVSSTIPITDFKTGFLFAVPDSASVADITGILIEDTKGSWTDSKGKHFRRLSQDEYLLMPVKRLIYLEKPAAGAVIAETAGKASLESSLSSFLKDTADWFGNRSAQSTYSMMGISCADEASGPAPSELAELFTTLTNGGTVSDGLYLKQNGTFSPFQVASLYQPPSSSDASVSTDNRNLYAEYTASVLLDNATQLIQLHTAGTGGNDFTQAEVRFPAAHDFPQVYVPSSGNTEDKTPSIIVTETEVAESFNIGTSAIESSIQVLKNGMTVPADYDRQTGEVTVASGYSENDTITILWNEYSAQSDDMKLTLSADFHATPTPFFKTSAVFTSLLSLDQETRKFSSSPDSEPLAAATLNGSWERSLGAFTLSAGNTVTANAVLASSSQKTPLFPVSGTGTEEIWFLSGAEKASHQPELTERYPGQAVSLPVLYAADASDFTISSRRKPGTSGLTLTLEGSLSRNTGTHQSWYAVDLPLSSGATTLSSAHEFSFTITDLEKSSSSYDVYLQLGECTWLISSASPTTPASDVLIPFVLTANDEQTVKVMLTDVDRMKLDSSRNMRLVIVNNDTASDTDIKIELSGAADGIGGIRYNLHSENAVGNHVQLPVSITETAFPSPYNESGWFSKTDDNKAVLISWNTDDASSGDTIIAERAFTSVSAARYQKAAFLVYVPAISIASDLTLTLLADSYDGYVPSDTFTITKEELDAAKGTWLTVTKALSTSDELSKVRLTIDAKPDGTNGVEEIYLGGVFLLDPLSSVTVSDEATASVNWSSDEYSASLTADASGAGTSYPSLSDRLRGKSLLSSVQASFIAPWLSVKGHGSFDLLTPSFISGDYLAATGNTFLYGVIGFSDNFRWNRNENSKYRKDTLTLSLEPIHVPLRTMASLETDRSNGFVTGNAVFEATGSYTIGETSVSLKAAQLKAPENAFSYYGSAGARLRTENASFIQKFSFADGAFTPVLEIGMSLRKENEKTESTGSLSQKLTLPFAIASNRISFTYSRESTSEYTPGRVPASYTDDVRSFIDAFDVHADSLSTVPVYDLLQDDLASRLKASLDSAAGTSHVSYITSSTTSWNRSLRADWVDLILPNAASITAERTVSAAGHNVLDRTTSTLSAAYTAFNVFGASSVLDLFDWYDQDEFQYSFKITTRSLHFQKAELTGYSTLYFENSGSLTSFYSGQLAEKGSYSHSFQFSWNRPATLFEMDAARITTGSFGYRKDSSSQKTSNAGLSHKVSVNINESFSVNGTASLNTSIRDVTTLSTTLSIGGKLQF